tara:strand:+ start:8220 stop:10028 length:1809 start_codon:yes stop_codon:yes gene_type:complete
MNYYEENINELRKCDPFLAAKIDSVKESGQLKVETSKTGKPTLKINDKYLHSKYDPLKEGEGWAQTFDIPKDISICVFGFGMGYHVRALLNRIEDPIYVVEPSLEILKCALEHLDLTEIIPKINWIVAKDISIVVREYSHLKFQLLSHSPSVNLLPDYYNSLTAKLTVCNLLEKIKLKVLVVNPIYGGSLPTAIYIKDALLNLGHSVEVMESDKFQESFFEINKVTTNQQNTGALISLFTNFLGEAATAKAAEVGPDLIIAVAQAPLGKETLSRLKELNAPLVFWFVEDFRVLSYWEKVVQHYDYIFTIQRGAFFEKLKCNEVKNYYYLPQACAPEKHCMFTMPAGEKKYFGSDLSFMGAGYYNRKVLLEKLIDFDFKIWGSGWDLSSPVGMLVQKDGTRVNEDECVKIYNAAKINLNLHSSSFHEGVNPVGDFVNPRTFEIAACGGFQLVDYRSELPELFEIGKEIICYKDLNELRSLIKYYLRNPDEKAKIAAQGQLRAKRDHSFENRMREMLSVIFENKIDRLRNLEKKGNHVDQLIKEAGSDTELGRYLAKFKNRDKFTLKDIIEDIEKGEGSLTKPESIFLVINQFIKEKGEKIDTK